MGLFDNRVLETPSWEDRKALNAHGQNIGFRERLQVRPSAGNTTTFELPLVLDDSWLAR